MSQAFRTSAQNGIAIRASTFNKVFRWNQDRPEAAQPASVELAGSFTNWERVAFDYDENSSAWQLTLHDIPGNHTHTYMLLVDGQPAQDKNADGLAIPQSIQEKQHQLTTPRGPRVFMLFSHAK